MSFQGEYRHSLDSKLRMSVPAKFRKVLPDELKITPVPNKGFGKALYVFTEEGFEAWLASFFDRKEGGYNAHSARDIAMSRYLNSHTESVTVDAAGRIKLSAKQCGEVGIEKDVTIVGAGSHVEIWDSATYDEYMASIDPFADFLED